MPAKRERIRSTQRYNGLNGDFGDPHFVGSVLQIDFCCGCGLAHETKYTVYPAKKRVRLKADMQHGPFAIGKFYVSRRVRSAPRRTAGKRRGLPAYLVKALKRYERES